MSQFVDECRLEWKRLGVPDPLANEMAADLTADLEEAESDGVSAEEVLGIGAFDPRSFAASWASERGLIQGSPSQGSPSKDRFRRRPGLLAAILVSAVLAVVGGTLAFLAFRSPHSAVVIPRPPYPGAEVPGPNAMAVPGPQAIAVQVSRFNPYVIGWVLLLVGIIGMISMLLWLWRRSQLPFRPSGTV